MDANWTNLGGGMYMYIQVSANLTVSLIVYIIRGSECHDHSLGEFNGVSLHIVKVELSLPKPFKTLATIMNTPLHLPG